VTRGPTPHVIDARDWSQPSQQSGHQLPRSPARRHRHRRHASDCGRLITSPVPARSSSHCVANYLIAAAAAQFADHLLTAVQPVNVNIAEVADGVVGTDAAHVAEPTLHYHGPDCRRLLRPRCEPRERQADTQFAASDIESGERPAAGSAAGRRLNGEAPEFGRGADREVVGLAVHLWSPYWRIAVLDRAPQAGRGPRG